jgi:hypothetical protein
VSCPSTTLCVAAENQGVAFSTHPAGGNGAWSFTPIPNQDFGDVFCSALPECFASGYPPLILASTDPTGSTKAWKASPSTPPFISGTCPTSNLCVAFNTTFVPTGLAGYYVGGIDTATDPGAGPWTNTSVPDIVSGLACPSASFCVAVGADGMLATSTDPAADIWTTTTIDDGIPLDAIACPSVLRCVASDDDGQILTSTNPAGGPSTWTTVTLDGCQTNPCSVEQILVSDGAGVHAVDDGGFEGKGPFLTNLKLTGDVLSWDHDGTPRSAVLQP